MSVVANIMLVAGVIIFALAVVGLFKFTDVYQRISAVGTAAALGMSLLVIGAFILVPSWFNLVLVLVILALQIATSSIGTMSIARSAYLTGSKMDPGYFDHLAEDQSKPETEVVPDTDIEQPVDADEQGAASDRP
jgi:multicomponent Na+:H+ antiporter subunit G